MKFEYDELDVKLVFTTSVPEFGPKLYLCRIDGTRAVGDDVTKYGAAAAAFLAMGEWLEKDKIKDKDKYKDKFKKKK